MSAFVGVDPGKKCRIACLNGEGIFVGLTEWAFNDETFRYERTDIVYGRIDVPALQGMQRLTLGIEHPGMRPQNASQDDARSWMRWGVLHERLHQERLQRLEVLRPQVWKEHFGLINREKIPKGLDPKEETKIRNERYRDSKEASRLLAIELFPDQADLLKRKMDHDRAEALLIAKYMHEVFSGEEG